MWLLLDRRLAIFGLNENSLATTHVSVMLGPVTWTFTAVTADVYNLCKPPIVLILVLEEMSPKEANLTSINSSSDMKNGESCPLRIVLRFLLQLHCPEPNNNIRSQHRPTTLVFLTTSSIVRGTNAHNTNHYPTWMACHGGREECFSFFG